MTLVGHYDCSRFSKKTRRAEGGCLLWTGYIHKPSGYGRADVRFGNAWKTMRAHRLSYLLFVGPIADGLLVCHKCDVRACVEPTHLFLGTDADNAYDSIDKGRRRSSIIRPKLTGADVELIRASIESSRILAERFVVARQTINKVRRGERWKRHSPDLVRDLRNATTASVSSTSTERAS